jgi:hypothetical protein
MSEDIKDTTEVDLDDLDQNQENTSESDDDVRIIDDADNKEESEPNNSEDEVQETIKRLDANLKHERRAREEAEKYARYAAERANQALDEVGDTQFHLVSNAYDTIRRENEILKAQLVEANSLGDYSRVAEIQENISLNAVKLNQLERGKEDLAARTKGSNHITPPPVFTPPQPRTFNEQFNEIMEAVSPQSASWLQKNRQNIRDQMDIQDMFNAHNSAVNRGIAPDTPEYFRFVEQRMGIPSESMRESISDARNAPSQRKNASPPAAPVNRTGNGYAPKGNEYTLTVEERDFADSIGMKRKDYAQHKLALRKEGKLTH